MEILSVVGALVHQNWGMGLKDCTPVKVKMSVVIQDGAL